MPRDVSLSNFKNLHTNATVESYKDILFLFLFLVGWEPGGAVNVVNVVKQAKQPSSREAVSCRS